MITGIREWTIVKEGGIVELTDVDIAPGTEVEVIVLIDDEIEPIGNLLSANADRGHLERAISNVEDSANETAQ